MELKACPRALRHSPCRLAADRARPHPRLLPEEELHRAERDRGVRERHRERHDVPVDRAGEPGRMVRSSGYGIERDVIASGGVEPAPLVGHERLLRVPRGAADVDVGRRIERHQSGVFAAPRSFDRPVEARAPDITVADEDQGETGEDDLVHWSPSVPWSPSLPSTPAPSPASPAALPPGPARFGPPPPPRN